MLLEDYGVDFVLQLEHSYLDTIFRRSLAAGDPCLVGLSTPVVNGDQTISTSYAALGWRQVDVVVGVDGDAALAITAEVMDGEVAVAGAGGSDRVVGPGQTFVIRASLSAEPAGDTLWLIADADVLAPLRIPIRLGLLSRGDLDLRLDAALDGTGADVTLKIVGTTLAIGGIVTPYIDGSRDWRPAVTNRGSFEASFNEQLIGSGEDWALAVDPWIVQQLVSTTPLPLSLISGDVTLDVVAIRPQQLEVDAHLIANYGGDSYEVCADVAIDLDLDRASSPPRIRGRYTITNTELCGEDSDVDWLVTLQEDLEDAGADVGELTLTAVNIFGDNGASVGVLDALTFTLTAERMMVSGRGTARAPGAAQLDMGAPDLTQSRPCFSTQPQSLTENISLRNVAPLGASEDLVICRVEITGPSADKFFIQGGPPSLPLRIMAGGGWTFQVRSEASLDATWNAQLEIGSNRGGAVLPIRVLLAPTSYDVTPPSLLIEGLSRPASCHRIAVNSATGYITVTNTGQGALTLCPMMISDEQGGHFVAHSVTIDDVVYEVSSSGTLVVTTSRRPYLLPGQEARIKVTVTPDDLDQEARASLTIRTSDGNTSVPLRGIIREHSDSTGVLTTSLDELQHTVCFLTEYGHFIHDLERLREPLELIEGIEGDCCPPRQQPLCLCMDFGVIELHELMGSGKVLAEAGGAPVFRGTLSPDAPRLVLPLANGSDVSLKTELHGDFSADQPLRGRIQRFKVARWSEWQGERSGDVTTVGDQVVALDGGLLRLIALDEAGRATELDQAELGGDFHAVITSNRRIYVTNGSQLLVFDEDAGKLRRAAEARLGYNMLAVTTQAASRLSRLQRAIGFGVRDRELVVLDITVPKAPRIVQQLELRIGSHAAALASDQLFLAGQEGVQRLQLSPRGRLSGGPSARIGDAALLLASRHGALVADGAGVLRWLDAKLETVSEIIVPKVWRDALPGGLLSRAGRFAIAARRDRRGFTTYRVKRGRFPR